MTENATSYEPTPEQLAAECLEIQATWTPEERLRRTRGDWRPTYIRADNVRENISQAAYDDHHAGRELSLATV